MRAVWTKRPGPFVAFLSITTMQLLVSMSASAFVGSDVAAAGRLPDLDRLLRLIERIKEWLTMGGAALAAVVSIFFIVSWVVSHYRRPTRESNALLSQIALWASYIPVLLTCVAGLGVIIPLLSALVLKALALAALAAAVSWLLSVASIGIGGHRKDLSKARRALLQAGTPWYCLATWLGGQLSL